MTSDDDIRAPLIASSDDPAPIPNSPVIKRNWIVRHWCGEETLGRSYWLNLVLLGNVSSTLVSLGVAQLQGLFDSFREVALSIIMLSVVGYIIWIWAIVGVFRSANRHTARGGVRFWADISRLIIGISVIASGFQIVTIYRASTNWQRSQRDTTQCRKCGPKIPLIPRPFGYRETLAKDRPKKCGSHSTRTH